MDKTSRNDFQTTSAASVGSSRIRRFQSFIAASRGTSSCEEAPLFRLSRSSRVSAFGRETSVTSPSTIMKRHHHHHHQQSQSQSITLPGETSRQKRTRIASRALQHVLGMSAYPSRELGIGERRHVRYCALDERESK
jgi:hypothetical protein